MSNESKEETPGPPPPPPTSAKEDIIQENIINKVLVEEDPKKKYRQKFRKEWLRRELFAGWLREVPGDFTKANCRFCKCTIAAKYYDLVKHSETKKHVNAASISQMGFLDDDDDFDSENDSFISKFRKLRKRRSSKYDENDDSLSLSYLKLREPEDEYDKVGAAWACELRKMDPEQQVFAKKAINDVLFEGRLGTLNRNSVIIISPPSTMQNSNFSYTDTVPPHGNVPPPSAPPHGNVPPPPPPAASHGNVHPHSSVPPQHGSVPSQHGNVPPPHGNVPPHMVRE